MSFDAQCRFCQERHQTLSAERLHDCPERARQSVTVAEPEQADILESAIHEFGAHLLFANARHGMQPYYALVKQFDHVLDGRDDDQPWLADVAGDDWLLPESGWEPFWSGGISAAREDAGYDTYNEYQVKLIADDDLAEQEAKSVSFQFRPALPDARTADGDRIQSMPEDMPEGLRVEINASNVHPDDMLELLRAIFDKIGIRTTYLQEQHIHEWSQVYNCARYVRLDRHVSEQQIVGAGALMDRLAQFGASNRGRGEYKWDNEEIMGHRTAVAMDSTQWNKLLAGRRVGGLLKSYHMKNPEKSPTQATAHPKLELQFSSEYSELYPVPWSADGRRYDLDDLLEELDETLINCLNWAGLNLDPSAPEWVEDQYFRPQASESRELRIVQDPTDHVADAERDMAAQQFLAADPSDSEEAILETIMRDGGQWHYENLAEETDTSVSTVYRAVSKVDDLVQRSQGYLEAQDDVIRERVAGIFEDIERGLEWADKQFEDLAVSEEVDPESPFAEWMETYGVSLRELDAFEGLQRGKDSYELKAAIDRGHWSELEIRQILRSGAIHARDSNFNLFDNLTNAIVEWRDRDGEVHRDPFLRFSGGRYKVFSETV